MRSYSSTSRIRRLLENTTFGAPEFLGNFSFVGETVPELTQVEGKIIKKLDELTDFSHSMPAVSLALNLSSASRLNQKKN